MHGLGKARYRGQRKVLLQIRLTATLVNLKKLFNLEIPTLDPAMRDRPGASPPIRPEITTTSPPTTPPKRTISAAT